MVYIISGGINKGKTRKILSIYNKSKCGDGFITQKTLYKNNLTGYKIVRLSTGESIQFIYKAGYEPIGLKEELRYGKFIFSKEGFVFAERIINNILERDINPLYIDEIGPVELNEKGLYKLLRKVLDAGFDTSKDLYITVRNTCVDDVIRKFNIRQFKISAVKG